MREYLKIRDDVDLKQLEKFGFKYRKGTNVLSEAYYHITKTKEDLFPREDCFVLLENRKITFGCWCYNLGVLFDLISAGLVEKVVEK